MTRRRQQLQWRLIGLLLAISLTIYRSFSGLWQLHFADNLRRRTEADIAIAPSVTGFAPRSARQEDISKSSSVSPILLSSVAAQGLKSPQSPENQNYAYAFLVAGCRNDTDGCLGYLYNILIAQYILNSTGSTADMVVMVRMSSASSSESLPPEQEKLLGDNSIRIQYLPRAAEDNFYTAVMDKFHVLNMTEYSRILYLDSDVIPLCNLDYVFDLSTGRQPLLKENFVVSWHNEPAQGGFFMLAPGAGELEELQGIVNAQEANVRRGSSWNDTVGWGHEIVPPDSWESRKKKNQTKWDFYGAFADQGLLYHWVKYAKKSASIATMHELHTWSSTTNSNGGFLQQTESDVFDNYTCSTMNLGEAEIFRYPPAKDFYHFTGDEKPWIKKYSRLPDDVVDIQSATTPSQLWFHAARRVIARNRLAISPYNMTGLTSGPLGRALIRKMKLKAVNAKRQQLSATR